MARRAHSRSGLLPALEGQVGDGLAGKGAGKGEMELRMGGRGEGSGFAVRTKELS